MAARRPMYVYGNTAPKPVYEPDREREDQDRESRRRKRHASSQVRQNRRRALYMNSGYVVFLTVAAVLALVVCVNYVKLQSRIASRSQEITSLQEELADIREENNTRYNSVMDAVNLEEIRERAQESLGMVYASEDQIVEYESPSADYVKQYKEIPEDGVTADESD